MAITICHETMLRLELLMKFFFALNVTDFIYVMDTWNVWIYIN